MTKLTFPRRPNRPSAPNPRPSKNHKHRWESTFAGTFSTRIPIARAELLRVVEVDFVSIHVPCPAIGKLQRWLLLRMGCCPRKLCQQLFCLTSGVTG